MPTHTPFAPAAALMFLTGIGIPVLAALNGGLGRQLDSSIAATAVLFVVGLGLSLIALAFVGAPAPERLLSARPWEYCAAFFVVFYILSITWAAPRIGVGNAVFFVLLGQIVAAALIDHFALLGAIRSEITLQRAAGLIVMAFGVYLAKRSG